MNPNELLDIIESNFNAKVAGDKETQRLLSILQRSKATQRDARRYAERLGELLGESFNEVYGFFDIPGDTISKELADRTVVPMLRKSRTKILEYADVSQKAAYEKSGLGLNPVTEAWEGSRAESLATGLASKVTDLTPEEAKPWFGEPMVTFSEKVLDDWVRENAKALRDAGFDPKIVREVEKSKTTTKSYGPYKGRKSKIKITYQSPCKWCQGLAGTYDYDDVSNRGNEVYRRHDGCRCTVLYTWNGKVRDVWSKKESTANLLERITHGQDRNT